MTKHAMFVDFESAGLWDDAVVLSFGATISTYEEKPDFKKLVAEGLYIEFDIIEQVQRFKRSTTQSTLDWWKKQSPEARRVWEPVGVSQFKKHSLEEFEMLCLTWLAEKSINPRDVALYDRTCFDVTKMQHIEQQSLGKEQVWWDYQEKYDVATALKFMGMDRYGGMPASDFEAQGAIYHNALHDAAMDHVRVLSALQVAA